MFLSRLGFSPYFQSLFPQHAQQHVRHQLEVEPTSRSPVLVPARVVRGGDEWIQLLGAEGVVQRALFRGGEHDDGNRVPVVGDWVVHEPARELVHAVLPRSTLFERKRAGRTSRTQALAANAERALLVMALGADESVRRLERYLALVHDAGAEPVICLTKAALVPDAEERAAAITAAIRGADAGATPRVLLLDLPTGLGGEELRAIVPAGVTAVLLGSSGAGKSTIVNHLADRPLAATRDVRASDATGRHTTTHRELFVLPGDDQGVLIDTPGLREVGLSASNESVEAVFGEVVAEAARCRFRDCSHGGEPGCAVQRAIEEGDIDPARLQSFQRLRDEAEGQTARERAQARRREEKTLGRERAVALRQRLRQKGR
jgi:ribosome biogenesis GTPase / thiamine phosphate phosphatase